MGIGCTGACAQEGELQSLRGHENGDPTANGPTCRQGFATRITGPVRVLYSWLVFATSSGLIDAL